ncbi:MAG: hypothetical protein ABW061_28820, partial [Polyangiaceae bacterium]
TLRWVEMSVRWFSWSCLSGLSVLSVACAGRFDPAHFEGSREARRAEPEAVLSVAQRSDEMESLGTVRAECQLQPGFRRLASERLSDLDCSSERLLLALRESAASAGGELLVNARCRSGRSSTALAGARQLECSAGVARYIAGSLAKQRPLSAPRSIAQGRPAPSASDIQRIDEPDASLAFRIELTFEPVVSFFESPALRGDQVRELSQLPVTHHPLGDLVASCSDACDERALRYGVLIAAGRLGAPDVVSVRCYRSGVGNACVGTLAAPEGDE